MILRNTSHQFFRRQQHDADIDVDINNISDHITHAFQVARKEILPASKVTARRPWISAKTLELTQLQAEARIGGNIAEKARLHKSIRNTAKLDRRHWLDGVVSSKSWRDLRTLRKGSQSNQGHLKDASGTLISSESRAQTLAEYLQDVQWAVRQRPWRQNLD